MIKQYVMIPVNKRNVKQFYLIKTICLIINFSNIQNETKSV